MTYRTIIKPILFLIVGTGSLIYFSCSSLGSPFLVQIFPFMTSSTSVNTLIFGRNLSFGLTLDLEGGGTFGYSVQLERGGTKVTGTNTSINPDGNISATFDMAGVPFGFYDLIFTANSGERSVLSKAMCVGDGILDLAIDHFPPGDISTGDPVQIQYNATNSSLSTLTDIKIQIFLATGLTHSFPPFLIDSGATFDKETGVWFIPSLDFGTTAHLFINTTADSPAGTSIITEAFTHEYTPCGDFESSFDALIIIP